MNFRYPKRVGTGCLLVIGAFIWQAQSLSAQQADDLEVLKLRPDFYMIAGAGGNVGVQIGDDGVILVDSGRGPMADRVLAEIKRLTDQPIRYIINTSADADHTGGNAQLAQAGRSLIPSAQPAAGIVNAMNNGGGAAILATENVLTRMSAPTGQVSPFPTSAWPSDTFGEDEHDLYLNGQGIQTLFQPAAHTDGDAIVFFRRSDVVVAGEIFDTTQFPVIDVAKGGGIQGEIDALNHVIDITIPAIPLVWQEGGTLVIPGKGRICDEADVVEYRDMITIIRDVIRDETKKGMTLDQIKKSDPTKEYRPRYGSDTGPWTTDMFVEAIYKSLTASK